MSGKNYSARHSQWLTRVVVAPRSPTARYIRECASYRLGVTSILCREVWRDIKRMARDFVSARAWTIWTLLVFDCHMAPDEWGS